jgi:hypothetical protein
MKRLIASCVVALLAVSVTLAGKSATDYDKTVDFTKYKTWAWQKHETGDDLWDTRLAENIERALTEKGWKKVEAMDQADAAVVAVINLKEETSYNTMYTGMGGWGYYGFGVGVSTAHTTASTWRIGTLLVDIFDAKTKGLLWRGSAEETASSKPEKNVKKLASATDKLFRDFPPEPPKKKK